MKNIVISIKNDNESRRNHVINEFKKSNVDFEFFDAITPEQITNTERETGINLSDSQLSPGGKGCLLSHIKIWKMAIENKNEYIAIFEDDIYLSPSSSIFLSNSKWIPSDIDIVKLEKYSKYFSRYNCKKTRTLDNRVLYEVKKCNLGTAGYIINIETAKKILNRLSSKKNILAIDIELFTPTLNNDINCFMIEPAICIQDFIFNNSKATSFPSFIMPKKNSMNTKKTFLTKIKKEISRLSPLSAIKKHVLSKKSTYR